MSSIIDGILYRVTKGQGNARRIIRQPTAVVYTYPSELAADVIAAARAVAQ